MRFSDYYNIIVNKKLQMFFFTKKTGGNCVFLIKQIIFFGTGWYYLSNCDMITVITDWLHTLDMEMRCIGYAEQLESAPYAGKRRIIRTA